MAWQMKNMMQMMQMENMSQAWPDEDIVYASVLSQAWPDRYFKTSSQKVQSYGRVRHSPTDALKQIHKNCKHKAMILSAESCCSSSMRARIQARFPMAERASSALPIGTARYSCAPSIILVTRQRLKRGDAYQ